MAETRNGWNGYFKNFLGAKTCIQDFKEWPKVYKLVFLVYAIVVIIFNFFSIQPLIIKEDVWNVADQLDLIKYNGTHFLPFIKFVDASLYGSAIADPSRGFAILTTVFYSMNGIVAISGLLSLISIINNKKSQYLWGAINSFSYSLFAITVGFTGDFIVYTFFFLTAPLGWYLFEIKKRNRRIMMYSKSWKKQVPFYLISAALIAAIITIWFFIIPLIYNGITGKNYANDILATAPNKLIFDAIATGLIFSGYIMQLINITEQFFIWSVLNILKLLQYTPLGFGTENAIPINMIIQYTCWSILGLMGLYHNIIQPIMRQIKKSEI
ncbi:nicotinamide mononucleotide transporter PnuC [Williamsoniiplasma somnilux]|uniref:Nicotinamide mononucleotide transporter PnuC n=1 Tax=Williamsoniiplasma somnilux TaxID=215578 RepID=A0A2K8NYR0_9MOLU|nr:nicotinamide mononucleotide transporter [Williamsoniiplasma somnilux]ATZ18937.1 nicotinamide mononucleotide transporter PnuC [Williamsoniiplasma somnilux]